MGPADFLGLETLLIDRLTTQLTGIKKVYGTAEMATLTQAKQVTPSIAVIYKNYRVLAVDGRKCRARVRQEWYTVLSVRNVADQTHGAAVRSDAGPIMKQVIDALMGWTPAAEFTALEIISGAPARNSAGVGHFPIGWATEVNL